jgi:hypothetical protein
VTEHPEPRKAAIRDRDVTLAMTPAQLLLAVVGIYLVLRFLRGLRG